MIQGSGGVITDRTRAPVMVSPPSSAKTESSVSDREADIDRLQRSVKKLTCGDVSGGELSSTPAENTVVLSHSQSATTTMQENDSLPPEGVSADDNTDLHSLSVASGIAISRIISDSPPGLARALIFEIWS